MNCDSSLIVRPYDSYWRVLVPSRPLTPLDEYILFKIYFFEVYIWTTLVLMQALFHIIRIVVEWMVPVFTSLKFKLLLIKFQFLIWCGDLSLRNEKRTDEWEKNLCEKINFLSLKNVWIHHERFSNIYFYSHYIHGLFQTYYTNICGAFVHRG